MRHGMVNKKLNRTSEHRKALLKNMLNSLIKYEQITTTLPKAKFLKPQADKIITLPEHALLYLSLATGSWISVHYQPLLGHLVRSGLSTHFSIQYFGKFTSVVENTTLFVY